MAGTILSDAVHFQTVQHFAAFKHKSSRLIMLDLADT
jgi:hypothetical protein